MNGSDPSPTRGLDPKDHIDRQAEQELFREIVSYETEARILTICDGGGRGKSSLLKRLVYNCEKELKPAVPSCLIELDKLSEHDPSPYGFADAVAGDAVAGEKGFSKRGEDVSKRFVKFRALDFARMSNNFAPFENAEQPHPPDHITATANATTIQRGGENIGHKHEQNIRNVEHMHMAAPELTRDQQDRAKEQCVRAFFDDLRRICDEEPLVLMLDAWEKCNLDLQEWISKTFLADNVVHPDREMRPRKLALVLAGRPHDWTTTPHGLRDDALEDLFDDRGDFETTVKSIKSLSREWENEHIRKFFDLNGFREPSDAEVTVIRDRVSKGVSLEKAASLIQQLRLLQAAEHG